MDQLGKGNSQTRRETFKFGDLVQLIEVWQYPVHNTILAAQRTIDSSTFGPVSNDTIYDQ